MRSVSRAACFFGLVTMAQAGCGAWEFHQAGIPIDKVPPPPQCKANPNCPPNDGNCCPTPGKLGSMLDCCNIFSCDCKSHPQCVNENKTGTCCPNEKGVYDPCCSNFQAAVNNPACEKAGVKGNACPDDKGKFHECCHSDAKCSYKNQCPGLAGDCCPTPGGMSLGCCLNKGNVASAVLLPEKDFCQQKCLAWCHKEHWGKGERCRAAYADHLERKAARNSGSFEDTQAIWCLKEHWGKGERCAAAYAEHMAHKAAISTTSGPAPSGSGLSQLAAVGMPTVGGAFFVVFVVGVAIGARFGRSSPQKDEYHVMG